MRCLASIALLGTLTLLTSSAQSQVRGGGGMRSGGGGGMRSGGGGGMRSGGGGGMRIGGGGGVRVGGPAPRVSAGRPMPSGPVGQGFRAGPGFRPQGAPVNNFNSHNFDRQRFNAQNRVFFNNRFDRFHSRFFRHHNFFNDGFFGFNNGFFGANCFGTFAFGNPFCGSFISSGFLFGDPFFGLGYGFGGYPYSGGYSSPPDYYPQQSSTSSDNNQVALAAEIQHLSDQIDDLRDEQALNREQQRQDSARSRASSGATLSAVPPAANTIFVLRDGRRFTAQNYAISGQTLWILNEHTARKTPLAEIDRDATEKANAANGVEVHLPEPTSPN
jgi:hypothetical protein